MKILVIKSSDCNFKQEKDYDSLEDCVEDILQNEDFMNNTPEVVVFKPRQPICKPEECKKYRYVVEIYDTWRE